MNVSALMVTVSLINISSTQHPNAYFSTIIHFHSQKNDVHNNITTDFSNGS